MICQCNQVTEKEIRTIIRKNNSNNLTDVQLLTAAGTRCGRCLSQVKAIVDDQCRKRDANQLRLF
jgi:bacterioferritin-associated ferredoxin